MVSFGQRSTPSSSRPTDRLASAYFIISPSWSTSTGDLEGTIANQGYVAVGNENVMCASIGVNAAGKGVMTFTLVGPDFFPSAAYVSINATDGRRGIIRVAAVGAAPEDGYSGYPAFGGDGVASWGDYPAAVAAPDGSIWMAVEYIPNLDGTQTVLGSALFSANQIFSELSGPFPQPIQFLVEFHSERSKDAPAWNKNLAVIISAILTCYYQP